MVAGVHDPQHPETALPLRLIGRPTRALGSPRDLKAPQGWFVPGRTRPTRLARVSPADRVDAQREVM